jgi:hypothetical protein
VKSASGEENRVRAKSKVRKGVHILRHTFCSHLAMRGAPGHPGTRRTQRARDDATLYFWQNIRCVNDFNDVLIVHPNSLGTPQINPRQTGYDFVKLSGQMGIELDW